MFTVSYFAIFPFFLYSRLITTLDLLISRNWLKGTSARQQATCHSLVKNNLWHFVGTMAIGYGAVVIQLVLLVLVFVVTRCYTHTKPWFSIPDLVYGTNNYRKLGNTHIFGKAIVNHQNMGGCCFTNCPPGPWFLQMFPSTKLLPGQDQQAATRLRCRFAAWRPRGRGPSEGSYWSQVIGWNPTSIGLLLFFWGYDGVWTFKSDDLGSVSCFTIITLIFETAQLATCVNLINFGVASWGGYSADVAYLC